MERSEFIAKLGLGLAAVCAGCSLASCGSGSKNNDPTPGTGTNPPATGTGNLFTVDLSGQLLNPGDSVIQGGVILARLAAGNSATSFAAVQSACTHEGATIGYNLGQDRFICPLHGSQFSDSGSVLLGPAGKALQKYTVGINGTILTVTA